MSAAIRFDIIAVKDLTLEGENFVRGALGGEPAKFSQAAFIQETSFDASSVLPTTRKNDLKFVILTDIVPPYGYASKIAFRCRHVGSNKSTTIIGFGTQYAINRYSVIDQEVQVNVGGFLCNFNAKKPFSVFSISIMVYGQL